MSEEKKPAPKVPDGHARFVTTRQLVIAGADHFYSGKEDELARVLREFIEAL